MASINSNMHEKIMEEMLTRERERQDQLEQEIQGKLASSSSEERQHLHFGQLNNQATSQSLASFLQGPEAASENGLLNRPRSQSERTQQIRSTISGSPLPNISHQSSHLTSGALLAQDEGLQFYQSLNHRNQYKSHSENVCHDDHLSQVVQVPNKNSELSVDQSIANNFNAHQVINKYHLPISNLPSEFRLGSSADQGQHNTSPQVLLPLDHSYDALVGAGANANANAQEASWFPPNQVLMHQASNRPLRIQGHNLPRISTSSTPASGGLPVGQRKMFWQNEVEPTPDAQYRYWSSANLNNQGQSSTASTHRLPRRYSLYDPMYEAIGIPVDPHIRLFLANNQSGSSG